MSFNVSPDRVGAPWSAVEQRNFQFFHSVADVLIVTHRQTDDWQLTAADAKLTAGQPAEPDACLARVLEKLVVKRGQLAQVLDCNHDVDDRQHVGFGPALDRVETFTRDLLIRREHDLVTPVLDQIDEPDQIAYLIVYDEHGRPFGHEILLYGSSPSLEKES